MHYKGNVYSTAPPVIRDGLVTGGQSVVKGQLVIQRAAAAAVNVHVFRPNSYDAETTLLECEGLALVEGVNPVPVLSQAAQTATAEPSARQCQLIMLQPGDVLESDIDLDTAADQLSFANQSTVPAATYTKQIDVTTTVGAANINAGFWAFLNSGTGSGQLGLIPVRDPNNAGTNQRHAFQSTGTFTTPIDGTTRGFAVPCQKKRAQLGVTSDFLRFRHVAAGEPRLTVREIERSEIDFGGTGNFQLLPPADAVTPFVIKTGLRVTGSKAKIRVIL